MPRNRNNIKQTVELIPTWRLLDAFLQGIKAFENSRLTVEELRSIPTTPGSYQRYSENAAEEIAIGGSHTIFVGYKPLFKKGMHNDPVAYDICFHTDTQGVVPLLRLKDMNLATPPEVRTINTLKQQANTAIAGKLGTNATLLRYQWYMSLLASLDIPLSTPSDSKRNVAVVLDEAGAQEGANVATKHGLFADDSSVAVKVMDHLGFVFDATSLRKKAPQYPLDLNGYVVSILEDNKEYTIAVTPDLAAMLVGSEATIVPRTNKAHSLFRPYFAASAVDAGEIFRENFGIPESKATIETDEEDEDYDEDFGLDGDNDDDDNDFDSGGYFEDDSLEDSDEDNSFSNLDFDSFDLGDEDGVVDDDDDDEDSSTLTPPHVERAGYKLEKTSKGIQVLHVVGTYRSMEEALAAVPGNRDLRRNAGVGNRASKRSAEVIFVEKSNKGFQATYGNDVIAVSRNMPALAEEIQQFIDEIGEDIAVMQIQPNGIQKELNLEDYLEAPRTFTSRPQPRKLPLGRNSRFRQFGDR